MKCADVIKKIESWSAVPVNHEKTCDRVKVGNAENAVEKVAVSMFGTPDVIRAAADWDAQLLIVHEPLFYEHHDIERDCDLAKLKERFIEQSGVTVYRFHDHAHAMEPDVIYDGELLKLGIEGERVKGDYYAINRFILKEPMTALELAAAFENKLGLKNVRIAGCTDKKGKTVSCCFGTPGHVEDELEKNDFVLAGEICEWRAGEMARDYAQLGFNKAVIVLTHAGSERDGMELLSRKIQAEYPGLAVRYFECGEVYSYVK